MYRDVQGPVLSGRCLPLSLFSCGEFISSHGDLANRSSCALLKEETVTHFKPHPVLLLFGTVVASCHPVSTSHVGKSSLCLLLGSVFPLEGRYLSSPSFLSPDLLPFLPIVDTERVQELSSNQEMARDTSQVFFIYIFSMASQSALAVQLRQPSHWVVRLGPHRREFPVVGQISEFEAFLPRDLAAGWSWLCETIPPQPAWVSAAEHGFHAVCT